MASPFVRPADLATWLGEDITDQPTSDMLTIVANAATDALVQVMNMDPRISDYEEWRNGTGSGGLPMNNAPIQAVSQVTINGMTILDLSRIAWDDNVIYRPECWPLGKRNIFIAYSAGLDKLPPAIAMACRYTAKAMWTARRHDMNASSESIDGVISQGFWQDGPGAVPPPALSLVRPYINHAIC